MKKKKKKTFPNSIFIHFGNFKKKKNLEGRFLCGLALTKLIT